MPLIHPNARDQYKGNGRFRTGISRPHKVPHMRGSSTIKEKTVCIEEKVKYLDKAHGIVIHVRQLGGM